MQSSRESDDWYAYRHWIYAAESTLMTMALSELLMTLTETQSAGLSGFVAAALKTVFEKFHPTVWVGPRGVRAAMVD